MIATIDRRRRRRGDGSQGYGWISDGLHPPDPHCPVDESTLTWEQT